MFKCLICNVGHETERNVWWCEQRFLWKVEKAALGQEVPYGIVKKLVRDEHV